MLIVVTLASRHPNQSPHHLMTDIGVLTVMIGYTNWQTRLVEDNRVNYCKRHGYGNHFLTQLVPAISNRTFGKFEYKARMLQELLPLHRMLLWLDADVLILDFGRPVVSFDKSALGYDVRVGGEMMTRYEYRYQFSAYSGLVRNSELGQHFVRHWVANLERSRRMCMRDQPSMRIALIETMLHAAGKSNRPHCMTRFTSCPMATRCLDTEAVKLVGGSPLKDDHSPKPIWFDDISSINTGIALQVKQSVFQWHNNNDESRHCWLPPLQKALLGAFAVHLNYINPFDFDNYVDYYHRQHGNSHLIPRYPYPRGCKRGDGSTMACCAYNPTPFTVRACASYGKRMGDWGRRDAMSFATPRHRRLCTSRPNL